MESMKVKKVLGTSLCVLFVCLIIGCLSGYVTKWLEWYTVYESFAYFAFWVILHLTTAGALLYAAIHKDVFNSVIGMVAAFVLMSVFVLFAISWICWRFAQFELFSFLGGYNALVWSLVELLMVAAMMFLSKAWLPLKVTATLAFIPRVISSIYVLKLRELTMPSGSEIESAISNIDLWNNIFVIMCLAALIVTIIWMSIYNTKPSNAINRNYEVI